MIHGTDPTNTLNSHALTIIIGLTIPRAVAKELELDEGQFIGFY
jgi:hypothetical protein